MSFRDRSFEPPRAAPPISFPTVQWNHRRGLPKGHERGGAEIPTRFFDEKTVAQLSEALGPPIAVQHSSGNEETAWLLPDFHFAPVGGLQNISWERRRGDIVEVASPGTPEPWNSGYRSRRRILGVIKELWEAGYKGFVVLSLRASTSQDYTPISYASYAFRTAAAAAAGQAGAYPEYAFWLPLHAGNPERRYDQEKTNYSLVSPLSTSLPQHDAAGEEDFDALVIPMDLQSFIEARLDEVLAWENWTPGTAPQTTQPAPASPASPAKRSTKQNAAKPAAPPPAPTDGHSEALDIVVPFGVKGKRGLRGKTIGTLLESAPGKDFVRYLASKHKARSRSEQAIVKAARAVVEAGLAA